jgi:ferrous iron transport protein A
VPRISPLPEGSRALPLSQCPAGRQRRVVAVAGAAPARRDLEQLGIVPGAVVTVLRQVRGDVIVRVAESRLALGRSRAACVETVDASWEVAPLAMAPQLAASAL